MDDRTLTALKASPTPAPWTYSGGEVLDAQGNQICQLYDSFRDPAEDDANGLLMAAAPEMRETVKALLAKHEAHHNSIEHAAARKVIAKSEGRS